MKVDADVVPAPGAGVAAVLRPGTDPGTAAQAVSRLLARADVLLLVREEGQVRAERWRAGALQDAPAAGLLLSGLPDVVESLVLHDTPAAGVEGAVSSAGMSRWKAMRTMWRAARAARPRS